MADHHLHIQVICTLMLGQQALLNCGASQHGDTYSLLACGNAVGGQL